MKAAVASGATGARAFAHDHGATCQSPDRRAEPLPQATRPQPGGVVPVGRGGLGQSEGRGQADLPLDRVRGVPLVPRHGARVVRGPGDRRAPRRALRRGQGGPRGEAGPRRRLHERGAGDDRLGRVAAVGVPHPRPEAVLRRHVLPSRARVGDALVPRGPRGGRRRLAGPPRTARRRGRDARRPTGGGRGAGSRLPSTPSSPPPPRCARSPSRRTGAGAASATLPSFRPRRDSSS